jgi:hypothetical protein
MRDNLIEAALRKEAIPPNVYDGRAAVALAEAAFRSLETGLAITIPQRRQGAAASPQSQGCDA